VYLGADGAVAVADPGTVTILDADDVRRALTRMAHEILEANRGSQDLALVGILSGGVPIAERLGQLIHRFDGRPVPTGRLDATAHRDDVERGAETTPTRTEIPFEITDRVIILVDEVLYTGRTARAAMDALMDLGRPRAIQLAVLIDRGHRELPIRPDFVGRNVPTSRDEHVNVVLGPDGDAVFIQRGRPAADSRGTMVDHA